MVVFCKRCGTPVKLDNARLADPGYSPKCHQCKRPVAMDSLRPGAHNSASSLTSASVSLNNAKSENTAQGLDKIHELQRIRLFSGLPYEECNLIESRLRPREYAPQQAIVSEGGPGDAMYLIKSGRVEVRKKDPITGIDFLVSELRAGMCFGEMALLTGKSRAATVVAAEPTTCLVLEQAAFDEVQLTSPKLALAMSRALADRLDEAGQQTGAEFVNLGRLQFDSRVIRLLPQSLLQKHQILPIAFSNNRLTLAMVNPNNVAALEDVHLILKGVIIEPAATSGVDFKRFMTTDYAELVQKGLEAKSRGLTSQDAGSSVAARGLEGESFRATSESAQIILKSLQSETLKPPGEARTSASREPITDLSPTDDNAPFIRIANGILSLAIKKGASDIHIEPQEEDLWIRFRIDGALHVAQVLPKGVQMGLIARFKAVSRLDTAEKRLPQTGRFSVRLDDRPIDFRVSTIPSKWGEKICLHILDKSNSLLGLDKLILHPEVLEVMREMIAQPGGAIYVTGPPGAGKTTTLYSALAELNDPDVNISTAEDPIQYDLPRLNQVQAQKEIGLDFPKILRSFLLQDPDVVMVDETLNQQTANLVVETALTGHLVLTSLRTISAAAVFPHLAGLGVDPFLLSSSTLGVVALRLARRLCQHCKESYAGDDLSLRYLGLDPSQQSIFYVSKGCDQCSGTGYRGRVGVYEILRMNRELRRAVARCASSGEILDTAVASGMKTLKNYSVWLLENGWTTMAEVLNAISVQE
jgi:type IV pilus assembly protein PilB